MKKYLAVLVAVLAIMSMAACGGETTELGKGQLALQLPTAPGLSVKAFKIEVFALESGQACPVLGETTPNPVFSECATFEAEHLPSGLAAPAPQGSKQHFSDRYFNLLAGKYCARATPMTSACANPVADCTVPQSVANVYQGATTEIVLISNCMRDDTGGLDVVAVLNNDPVIEGLNYSPSKFICTTTALTVTVTVDEPDGDPLVYTWEWLDGSTWNLVLPGTCTATNNVLNCPALSLSGNYQMRVKACDPGNLCAKLQFPVHASPTPCP